MELGDKDTSVPAQLAKIFNIPKEKAEEIWKAEKENLLIGKETPKEFLVRMNNIINVSLDPEKAHKTWMSLYNIEKEKINWELVNYVEFLKNRYEIHMLTNIIGLEHENSQWYDAATQHFKNIYRSFQIGHKKPNKEAYLHVLEKIGAKPEECVFIDDTQANVDAANNLGIKGIFYHNFEQLKKDFITLGVEL